MARYRKTRCRNKPVRIKLRRVERMRPRYLRQRGLPCWADPSVAKILRKPRP